MGPNAAAPWVPLQLHRMHEGCTHIVHCVHHQHKGWGTSLSCLCPLAFLTNVF